MVTPLCVLDFETADRRARLRSVHPGVTVAQVTDATEFDLAIAPGLTESAPPTEAELEVLRELVDPLGTRQMEFKELRPAASARIEEQRTRR